MSILSIAGGTNMTTLLRGLSFPLELDGKGGLKVSEDAELILDHILSMLLIEPGENPMRLQYGIPGILFNSNSNFDEYSADVARRLEKEIPQANFIVTGSLGDEGEALLDIQWTYLGNAQDNIQVALN
jgi:hypothetical protein